MPYEYRVMRNYIDPEHGFELVEGDVVIDGQFPEPDIPGRLIGRGILQPADMEAEAARLADAPKEKQKRHSNEQ